MPDTNADLSALSVRLKAFRDARNWDQFHSPKNLATALTVEAAELLEQFQWLSEAESASLSDEQLGRVRQEMADVLIYLVQLADRLSVDLMAAADEKLALNEAKYPVARSRGVSTKYTEL